MIRQTSFYEEIKKIEVKRKYVYISWCNGHITRSLKNKTDIEISVAINRDLFENSDNLLGGW